MLFFDEVGTHGCYVGWNCATLMMNLISCLASMMMNLIKIHNNVLPCFLFSLSRWHIWRHVVFHRTPAHQHYWWDSQSKQECKASHNTQTNNKVCGQQLEQEVEGCIHNGVLRSWTTQCMHNTITLATMMMNLIATLNKASNASMSKGSVWTAARARSWRLHPQWGAKKLNNTMHA